MSNNIRTRNGMPYNFVNGLKVRGMDIESLIPGIEGIPEAGSKYQFAGDGTNNIFTLPVSPYNKDAVDVYVKQLYVHPDDYTLAGDTITLVEAPPAVVAGETYNVVIKVSLTTLNGYVNASRVSFEGENLDDILEKNKPITNYPALRAYAGAATQVRITDPSIAGFFYYDAADTASADNGGTIIASSNGRRWKRLFDGAVSVKDFGAVGDGVTDDTDALQQAINTGKDVDLLGLTLKISYGVLANTEGQTISNGKIVSSDSFSSAATGQFQFKITSKRVVFQNIYFDINGLAGGSQDFSAFIANGVSNCNGALLFNGGHYSSVKNCYFTRTYVGKTAVSFFGVDQNLYTTVDKCTFEYNYGGAVFTQSAGLHVSNCVVRKSNDAGIAFNTGGAKHGSVTGCHVEDCQYGGIAVESNAHHITITGNTFYQTLFGSNDCSILITSFVAGDASCYSVSISGNTFNAYKATGTGDTVVSSIIVQGGTDINISGNTYFSGGGAHNKFVFLQPLFGELNNINISNNTITGGRIGSLYTNYASSNIDKVVFSNNLYDGGIEFFRAIGIPSLPTQSTGIIFDSNIMPNTTGPDFDGPSAGNVKWTFSKNYTPTWTSFGGGSLGALTNTFNIRYSDVDGAWVSNAAPTKLAWKAGDRVKTITPSVGQPKGWVCTVAGTPGTWVSEGNL